MSDEAKTTPPAVEQVEKKEETTAPATTETETAEGASDEKDAAGAKSDGPEANKTEGAADEAQPSTDADAKDDADKATKDDAKDDVAEEKADGADAEMKDATEPAAADAETTEVEVDADASAVADDSVMVDETATPNNSKNRRKSASGAASGGKKLNKKASKAKLFHTDAQPGEHYLVKLKGHPLWPVIIADEDMLPHQLLRSRPKSALKPDGTYNPEYADGAKRINDRQFPVMYLRTLEFGWVPNSALQQLSGERATEMLTDKIKKKDLREAFELAIEQHPLEHYKAELSAIQQEQAAFLAAQEEKKKPKKAAAKNDDVDMADADEEAGEKPKSAKKRKAEEMATPQRSDSTKKPKIKLTTSSTPKSSANGATPKSTKDSTKSKSKAKKDSEDKKAPKEPQLTPEEARARKEKEVLFLRHKLQRGLLTREQTPKEEDMKTMSDYIAKLENLPDLEVSIIRATKINKVLKAILKLESIPRESEFNFKSRSQTLLDQWTKILNSSEGASAPSANGVNGDAKKAGSTPAADETNGDKEEANKEPSKSEETDEKPKEPAEDGAESKEAEVEA